MLKREVTGDSNISFNYMSLEGRDMPLRKRPPKKIRELQWNTTTVSLSLVCKEGKREMNVPYFYLYLAKAIH